MEFNVPVSDEFAKEVKYLSNKYGERITELNGFSQEQLGMTTFIDNFVDTDTVADASIDPNANVGQKDIVAMQKEMSKPISKLLALNKIHYEIVKKYGLDTANQWLEGEWNGRMYLHNAPTASFLPYCFAYDIDRLAKEGLYFIPDFNGEAPKHLTTFTDFVGEFVSYAANRSSGAVGLPSFLIYSFYFWKKDCETGYAAKDPTYYAKQEFQRITYKLNQPYLRVNQSAFTNFSIFDHNYFESLFGGKEFPGELTTADGTKSSFMIDFEEEFIEYQKLFMETVSEIRSHNMMTFPVLTISLLYQNGKFVDEPFARWANKHNMKWDDSNFYVSGSVDTLSNCCRLLSNIKDLGFCNSIGGTALEVGSVQVSTINLARISYESKTKEEYLKQLREETVLDLKMLDRVRHIIKRNIDKGLLPNYKYGLLHMKNQYNTIGINGMFEAIDHFGMIRRDEFGYAYYTEDGLAFAEEILATVNEVKDEFAKDKDYMINIEQVPAERCAAIFMEKDKELYPDERYELPLYGNQWIPLGVKCTVDEKIRTASALDKACNGGAIAHINLDKPLNDEEESWNLLNYIASRGVIYFAFCTRISACKNNHGFYGDVCPECGEPKITTYQRVVGFLTPEKNYSKERKAEFKMRTWFDLDSLSELG